MPARHGPLERALANVRRLEEDAIRDLTAARLSAGLARSVLGRAVGLSEYEIGRIDRRELSSVTLEDLARYGAGVGLRVHLRLYPDGDPLRDAGQVRVLHRLRRDLPEGMRLRLEVPIPGASDLRAWDGMLDGHGCLDAVEVETRFIDEQATVRRIMLKARDDRRVRHVVLVLPVTRTNRRTLAVAQESLRDTFPLDTRETMASLRAGRCPGANAIVLV
jgi:hypothetical protein